MCLTGSVHITSFGAVRGRVRSECCGGQGRPGALPPWQEGEKPCFSQRCAVIWSCQYHQSVILQAERGFEPPQRECLKILTLPSPLCCLQERNIPHLPPGGLTGCFLLWNTSLWRRDWRRDWDIPGEVVLGFVISLMRLYPFRAGGVLTLAPFCFQLA